MKMKVVVMIVTTLLVVLELLFSLPKALIILAPPIIFGLAANIRPSRKGVSYLNELPNVLRVLFASIGAALISYSSFSYVVIGCLFVLLGVFANDEAVRRLYRQKGVIVLSGIDATGKSTHVRNISFWLKSKGINCKIVPFHKYLFLGNLSSLKSDREEAAQAVRKRVPLAGTSKLSLVRPYVALIDNILFYVLKILPRLTKGQYVVCDRFIWDNYVKHKALGYNTRFLFRLAILIKPQIGIVLDLPADAAFERVERRKRHLQYSIGQYEIERKEFRKIAKILNYLVIETNEPIQQTWNKIEAYLSQFIQ